MANLATYFGGPRPYNRRSSALKRVLDPRNRKENHSFFAFSVAVIKCTGRHSIKHISQHVKRREQVKFHAAEEKQKDEKTRGEFAVHAVSVTKSNWFSTPNLCRPVQIPKRSTSSVLVQTLRFHNPRRRDYAPTRTHSSLSLWGQFS